MCACEFIRTHLIVRDRKPQELFDSQIYGLQPWLDLGAQLLLSEICIFLSIHLLSFVLFYSQAGSPPQMVAKMITNSVSSHPAILAI